MAQHIGTEREPLLSSAAADPDMNDVDLDKTPKSIGHGREASAPPYTTFPPVEPAGGGSARPGQPGNETDNLVDVDDDMPLHPLSNTEAMMNLMKGNVGTGVLAMPNAFMNAGLWVGLTGTLFIGLIAVHCMHVLVKCAHHLCDKLGLQRLDYGGVGVEAFNEGPPKLRWLSRYIRLIINIFLCLTQFGFCVVYILFIADNCRQVLEAKADYSPNIRLCQFYVFLLLLPFVFVRTLKYLAIFATIANLVTAVGMVIILQHCVHDLPPSDSLPAFSSWAKLPLFFGTVVYAFEGIGVVLPIENKMKNPWDFVGLNGVLNTAMVIVTCLYTAVGFYGYMKYGDNVESSITLNLPTDDWLYLSVKLMFAFAIYITYGVQFYVGVQVSWHYLEPRLHSDRSKLIGELVLRVGVLCITFLLAVLIPHLDLMISLIGAFSSCALAILFPAIFELVCFWDQLTFTLWFKDIFIIVFGLLGFVAGTITTLIEIVKTF